MGWQLWRQDDNGNRFPVAVFTCKQQAEERIRELTRCQHKQLYWIEHATGQTQTGHQERAAS